MMLHRIELNRKEHKGKIRRERKEGNFLVLFARNFAPFAVKINLRNISI